MIDAKDNFLKAVAAFERTFKCFIAVHDYAGLIRESLPELPVYHLNPYCTIIKSRKSEHLSCIAFDSKYVQERLSQNNEPFWKLCQHGLFEAVIPVVNEGRTLGVVFAGPFRGNSKNFIDVLLTGRKPDELPEKWSKKIPEVAPSANSPVIALGGLLASGIIGVIAETRKRKMSGGISRKEVIGDFFERNHSRQIMLSDLAGHLNLCDSRTSQLLKQYFNKALPNCSMSTG